MEKSLEEREKRIFHLEKALLTANQTITQLKERRLSLSDEQKAALIAQHL
jgi:uncharacterized protein YdcH (DUF465 family)